TLALALNIDAGCQPTHLATRPYRYGNTSLSIGGSKSEGFPCPKGRTVNIVSLAYHIIAGSFVGEEAMSPVLKRSVVIAGHKTSVSVEDEFWDSFKEIASEHGMTVAAMIGKIDGGRKHANLSSAIRLFVLGVYRDQIASWGRP
ncbi:MAG TPA: ribbon-helix-helix domain-containing protein, partial [Candidatus Acidoferrales bacterium]|nr:ribbon-helix-helix domain-containing protein [Candidatus Acidoferrales bacterium]